MRIAGVRLGAPVARLLSEIVESEGYPETAGKIADAIERQNDRSTADARGLRGDLWCAGSQLPCISAPAPHRTPRGAATPSPYHRRIDELMLRDAGRFPDAPTLDCGRQNSPRCAAEARRAQLAGAASSKKKKKKKKKKMLSEILESEGYPGRPQDHPYPTGQTIEAPLTLEDYEGISGVLGYNCPASLHRLRTDSRVLPPADRISRGPSLGLRPRAQPVDEPPEYRLRPLQFQELSDEGLRTLPLGLNGRPEVLCLGTERLGVGPELRCLGPELRSLGPGLRSLDPELAGIDPVALERLDPSLDIARATGALARYDTDRVSDRGDVAADRCELLAPRAARSPARESAGETEAAPDRCRARSASPRGAGCQGASAPVRRRLRRRRAVPTCPRAWPARSRSCTRRS